MNSQISSMITIDNLKDVLNQTSDIVIICNHENQIIFVNNSALLKLKYAEADMLINHDIFELFPVHVRKFFQSDAFEIAINDGFWHGEAAFITNEKRGLPVITRIISHKNEDGYIYFTFISEDISSDISQAISIAMAERKRVEEAQLRQRIEENKKLERALIEVRENHQQLKDVHIQLVQAEKMASVGQLAAGIAHEINNPLAFVSSNMGTLRKYVDRILSIMKHYENVIDKTIVDEAALTTLDQLKKKLQFEFVCDDLKNVLSDSDEGLNRVRNIVVDLLGFSRAGVDSIEKADINKALESTLNIANHELKYKATVIKDFADLPLVECMPSRLNQVFINLILNAAHALEVNGEIQIRTRKSNRYVVISIIDNGCGIAPENMNRIFEPFFTTKGVGKGTGMGLSLSYSIIEKHGGSIDVESEVGKGTCFNINLPISRDKIKESEGATKFDRINMRFILHMHGEFHMNDGDATIVGATRDISLGGVFLQCQKQNKCILGKEGRLELTLNSKKISKHPIMINFQCQVMRIEEDGLGLKLLEVSYDDFDLFRKFMVHYSPDPHGLLTELENIPHFVLEK